MIESLAKSYLERKGYLVLPNRVPMLLVSGNAVASPVTKDRIVWQVMFPSRPYIVALNNSVVS